MRNILTRRPWVGLIIIGGLVLCAGFLFDPMLD